MQYYFNETKEGFVHGELLSGVFFADGSKAGGTVRPCTGSARNNVFHRVSSG